MDVLEKIKTLRKEKGWTWAALAKKADLSPTTISMMYKRNNQPTIPTLQALCAAFGITMAQFFSDANVPPDLTPEQIRLLEQWNTLNDEQKEALFIIIKNL